MTDVVPGPAVDVFGGVRVVELGQFVFVPQAAALLADWGAEVIKIEHPVRGDGYRAQVSQGIIPRSKAGVSYSMELANRGKRSIGLDVSSEEGKKVFLELIQSADVFLTNILPSSLDKWGLGVEDLREVNPRLIYARGHGFGVRGPDADQPGYDGSAYWGRGAIGTTLSPPNLQAPINPRGAFGDRPAAVHLAFGVSAALFRRAQTGEPSVVDVSLLGSALWALASDVISALQDNFHAAPVPGQDARHGSNALAATYKTSDDRWLSVMVLQPDRHWPELAKAIDREDLLSDPRFADGEGVLAHTVELVDIIEPIFASRTLAEWREAFLGKRFPWAPYATVPELLEDPQVEANGYLGYLDHPAERFRLPTGPVQFDELPASLRRGPEHAEHTEAILLELGRTWDEIGALKAAGVIT